MIKKITVIFEKIKREKMRTIMKKFEKTNVELDKTITQATNNGGAVSYQIMDALEYIYDKKVKDEISFIEHLVDTNQATHESIEHFVRHFLFDSSSAVKFVEWKRDVISA